MPRYEPCDEPTAGRLLRLVERLRRLAQLETQFQQTLEREKLAAMQQLAYGASHEINNPLANISTRAQTLLREETDPERRRKLATINSQAFRAFEMISDLMLFAKPPQLERSRQDLGPLLAQVVEETKELADPQGTQLELPLAEVPIYVEVDPTHLQAALKALCRNSLEALRAGGKVMLSASETEREGQSWVEIRVADNGPGIPAAVRRHLFDPFYSGREAGRGLGLGLSKVWRVAQLHGGELELSDAVEQGACFVLRLPAGARETQRTPAASEA